ncbi:MAG: methyltransferase domain-containing protein, partial [Verrucomicrobia bacterium]|nr:methyltransferase domain-containing protein [Verrucomicrobiota bacterium]
TMLAAGGKLFVVTRAGALYCFGAKAVAPRHYPLEARPFPRPPDTWAGKARLALQHARTVEGYALVCGLGTGRLAEELAAQSQLHLVVVEPDAQRVAAFRSRLDAAGLYGQRVVAHAGDPLDFGLPPYFANLIVCEDLNAAGFESGEKWLRTMFQSLRPYGGVLCMETTNEQHDAIASWMKQPTMAGAQLGRERGLTLVTRAGPLPGAADYTGQAGHDQLVKAPLGLLWFGDTAHHHKLFYQGYEHEAGRGLPPYLRVVNGVMSYVVAKEPIGQKLDSMSYKDFLEYVSDRPHAEVHTDIYTGRTLSRGENAGAAGPPKAFGAGTARPSPLPLTRKNPITGVEEAREFLKTYGCDQIGADYGNIITMRSGTAAFYDKRAESGTINVSGTRSGCRNSMVVAGGLLNVPAWTGNCTCNYPVFTSLALTPMPPQFEQWTAWGGVALDAPMQRVGINFGAPGDRMDADGTLWLDWPSVGGPSPDVRVRVTPETAEPFYRHALWMKGGSGWPWVFASGIKGVRAIEIETVARCTNAPSERFSVRWTGQIEPKFSEEYTFHTRSDGPMHVWIGNRPLLDSTLKPFRDGQREASAKIALVAGTKYDLLVDYKHAPAAKPAPAAFAELSWSSSSVPKAVIPPEQLLSPDGRRGGLAGVYYNTERLTGPALFQRDAQVRFEWGQELPPILKPRPSVQPVERAYTVRLGFAEPEAIRAGERVFSVKLQGNEVLKNFDILQQGGGPHRGVVREFRGIRARATIHVELSAATKRSPLICGMELIAE